MTHKQKTQTKIKHQIQTHIFLSRLYVKYLMENFKIDTKLKGFHFEVCTNPRGNVCISNFQDFKV